MNEIAKRGPGRPPMDPEAKRWHKNMRLTRSTHHLLVKLAPLVGSEARAMERAIAELAERLGVE